MARAGRSPGPRGADGGYRVLGVMAALVGIVALCVSLLPAFRVRSATLTLSRGTRGSPGRGVARWGRWLAAAQVALSVPLLVTAWIVATDLHRLERVSTGFQPDDVIAVHLARQGGATPVADHLAYLISLASGLRAIPGISSAALSWSEPVSQIGGPRRRPITGGDGLHRVTAFVELVSPDYFETLSVPLVAGRDFTGPTTAVSGTSRSCPRDSPARGFQAPIRSASASGWGPDRRFRGGDWRGGGRPARRAAPDEPTVSLYAAAAAASTLP